jgi:hypothetical protein
MEEERAWRQAQLDAQPGWTDQLASGLGSVLPYLALAYMNKGNGQVKSQSPALPFVEDMWWLDSNTMRQNQSYIPNFSR